MQDDPMMANGQPVLLAGLFTMQGLVDPIEAVESRLDIQRVVDNVFEICDYCPDTEGERYERRNSSLGTVARFSMCTSEV
jgi:hypothetical protein